MHFFGDESVQLEPDLCHPVDDARQLATPRVRSHFLFDETALEMAAQEVAHWFRLNRQLNPTKAMMHRM